MISTEPSEMIRDFDEDSNINEEECGESSYESSHHRKRLAVTENNQRPLPTGSFEND